jgi:hypothetical protein
LWGIRYARTRLVGTCYGSCLYCRVVQPLLDAMCARGGVGAQRPVGRGVGCAPCGAREWNVSLGSSLCLCHRCTPSAHCHQLQHSDYVSLASFMVPVRCREAIGTRSSLHHIFQWRGSLRALAHCSYFACAKERSGVTSPDSSSSSLCRSYVALALAFETWVLFWRDTWSMFCSRLATRQSVRLAPRFHGTQNMEQVLTAGSAGAGVPRTAKYGATHAKHGARFGSP